MGISPNSFGMHMATAAYSPEGAAWVDDIDAPTLMATGVSSTTG